MQNQKHQHSRRNNPPQQLQQKEEIDSLHNYYETLIY